MAITVAAVKAKIIRRFPDSAVNDVYLEYVNEEHQFLLSQLPLITATEDLSLTAGTQEYAINEDCIRIVAAEYLTSATDRRALVATDIDYLNSEQANWRRRNQGTPARFYLYRSATANVVGLDPKPGTTTASGYPIVRLHQTRVETLSAGSSLPKSILTKDIYVYGSMLRFAMDNRTYQDEIPLLKQLYDDALAVERKVFDQRHPYKRRIGVTGIGMGGVS